MTDTALNLPGKPNPEPTPIPKNESIPIPKQESTPLPRIRGDNPPLASLQIAHDLTHENSDFPLLIGLCCFAFAIGIILVFLRWPSLGALCVLIAPYLGYLVYKNYSNYRDHAAEFSKIVNLHAYNTEFTSVLADNSLHLTVILFQIPTNFQGIIEQLNRITEGIILRFVAAKSKPVTGIELEEHLRTNLVQFQDENKLSVLRLQVVTHVHAPAKRSLSV